MKRANATNVMDRRAFVGVLGAGVASLALAACGGARNVSSNSASPANAVSPATPEASGDGTATAAQAPATTSAQATPAVGKAAVVYFSWSGNTRSMAERIAQLSGATTFELVPETPYPEEYNACTDEALTEQRAGTLRPYQGDIANWDDISTVFVGYPIWWMDLPQVAKKFVADHNWVGKTVIPFCSDYNSGWSGTQEDLASTCSGATLKEGIGLAQGELPGALERIDAWYAGLNLA